MMTNKSEPHIHKVRVYYEDTDAGGVVYHARYLGFLERARTEWLRTLGANHRQLLAEHNLLFTVRRLSIEYYAPAKLDDLLEISTEITACGAATLDMRQIIRHEGACRGDHKKDKTLVEMTVTLVAITPGGKVLRLPPELRG
jgi:acyl-CoA thioester hydrolase